MSQLIQRILSDPQPPGTHAPSGPACGACVAQIGELKAMQRKEYVEIGALYPLGCGLKSARNRLVGLAEELAALFMISTKPTGTVGVSPGALAKLGFIYIDKHLNEMNPDTIFQKHSSRPQRSRGNHHTQPMSS